MSDKRLRYKLKSNSRTFQLRAHPKSAGFVDAKSDAFIKLDFKFDPSTRIPQSEKPKILVLLMPEKDGDADPITSWRDPGTKKIILETRFENCDQCKEEPTSYDFWTQVIFVSLLTFLALEYL